MEDADFSGYATKAGLKCSDGRIIMKDAFAHQDGQKVPLVWAHTHDDPENVLGHAFLEARDDGVYTYAYFNQTPKAQAAKIGVQHGDIVAMSIYANQLIEKSKNVLHGAIKEVSLVLSGANPGALIDNLGIRHSDGSVADLEDEAIIHTGLPLEGFAHEEPENAVNQPKEEPTTAVTEAVVVAPAVAPEASAEGVTEVETGDTTEVASTEGEVKHADMDKADPSDKTVQDVYDSMSQEQKDVTNFLVAVAVEAAQTTAQHSDETGEGSTSDTSATVTHSDNTGEGNLNHNQEGSTMTNVFEQQGGSTAQGATLTHDDFEQIVKMAQKDGSFKEAALAHASATYGIENIDILFPDAANVGGVDVIGRRQEWVTDVINGTNHSPFSRIKSRAVDLTADEARAKGYVKGNLKKEEIIRLLKRVTTPTTVYKKQKLDRDDVVDITDLDVVAWLKAEMRVMLDEEVARAVLVGDGREADDEDKINPDHVRPIAYDNDMYAHQLVVASELSGEAVIEAILRARTYYKGTGTPNFYTTDRILTDLILLKDKMGRRLYRNEAELAAELRVGKIVPVEVMEDTPDVVGIVVNLVDYTIGADRGGNVTMFEDFDIDYNQQKYLIETRISGALTRPKSALVVKRTLGTVVSPTSPSFNGETNTVTYPSTPGVVYTVDGVPQSGSKVLDETTDVESRPATGYSFPPNTPRNWTFVVTG